MRLIRSFQLSRLSNGLVEVPHSLGPVRLFSALAQLFPKLRVCARRGITAVCEPIKHRPLSALKRAALFTPVRHRARADCIFLCKFAVGRNCLQIFFCPQFFALLENLGQDPILLIVHIVGNGHAEEALLDDIKCSIP